MHFEHLIEINDPANPLVPFLTRHELWYGVWRRVEDPVPFLPGLVGCRILSRSDRGVIRRLDFGGAQIQDEVSFQTEEWVCFTTLPTGEHPGGSLTIRIEEPQPGALFLRFTYQTSLAEGANDPDAGYVDYVKSAYLESDIDMVRVIRTLLADGTRH